MHGFLLLDQKAGEECRESGKGGKIWILNDLYNTKVLPVSAQVIHTCYSHVQLLYVAHGECADRPWK